MEAPFAVPLGRTVKTIKFGLLDGYKTVFEELAGFRKDILVSNQTWAAIRSQVEAAVRYRRFVISVVQNLGVAVTIVSTVCSLPPLWHQSIAGCLSTICGAWLGASWGCAAIYAVHVLTLRLARCPRASHNTLGIEC